MFDVAIVGGGPAGSSCAAFCAAAGLRTVVLEREKFPREKVCGDCLNPACWPILRRLELAERVRGLPHGKLDCVEFIGIGGRRVTVELPAGEDAEIAVKRSLFDQLLLERSPRFRLPTRARTTGRSPPAIKRFELECSSPQMAGTRPSRVSAGCAPAARKSESRFKRIGHSRRISATA